MKTAVFIPVRTKSTRLPGKALLEVNGRPIIEYLIERVKSAGKPDLIVICTTTNPEDRVLVPIAAKNNIEIFQGSEKDILARYLQAADKFGVDFIVNVDGDDIFCDPEYMDKVVETFLKTSADYIECQGLPFGAVPGGIKVEALKKVCQMKNEDNTETGWKRFFTESGLFRIEAIEAAKDVRQPDIRMSLDYAEDFQFFREVIQRLYVPGRVFSLREILALLKDHPEIAAINRNRQEEYWATYHKNAAKIKWR
ncbi:MAG: hypothetical protein KAV87_33740 [Desulfobacteraceae bacterium]|nr:hypothetical protein [Desulfobacteraceae bacterium]